MTIKDNPMASTLGVLRTTAGVTGWLSPRFLGRVAGLGDVGADERAALITRLFGVRDATLAQAVLLSHGERRRTALAMGAVCDSMDILASLITLRRGGSKAAVVFVGGGAAMFLVMGLAALAQESRAGGETPHP